MHTEREEDVPSNKVEGKIKICKASGATSVEKVAQPNGKFTIIATYEDDASTGTTTLPAPAAQGDRVHQAMDYFVGQGWTAPQAAGIVANLQAESKFRPDAVGDGGQAYGIAQWHPDRQANFPKFIPGRAIQGSTFEEQLGFVQYELTRGQEVGAGKLLKNANSANEAGSIVSKHYERPADREGEATRRGQSAEQILNNYH